MKHTRILAAVCAAVICCGMTGALPMQTVKTSRVSAAEEVLSTRNSHIDMTGVHTWESEHFCFYWGDTGTDSARVTEALLAETAQHLEACYQVYMNDLSMAPPTESFYPALRDGKQYKVNFYIHGTGLKTADGTPVTPDWAYMSSDAQGYAFMFCCVDSMQNTPVPSWIMPHEFGHVVTAHQRGWNDNTYVGAWWESVANWYREQFLYSDYYQKWVSDPASGTDYFETYMKNLHFTPILGRDNYASWAFLQYLTENPDNLGKYGSDFVKTLMQEGKPNEYPYDEIARLGGADIKDTLGHYAKRLATLDLAHHDSYMARQDKMLADQPWSWNQIFTVPERVRDADSIMIADKVQENGYYTVPTERAPQQFGVNIIPLVPDDAKFSVRLDGLTDVEGADWRACIVMETFDGKAHYSDLFKAGETMTVTMTKSDVKAYLVVTATPDLETCQHNAVPWAYTEGASDENHVPFLSKTRYPYAVEIKGATVQQKYDTGVAGHIHPNGGGFVADTATVADSVYVAENAQVLGWANVSGNVKILGHAIVAGTAKVSGNAIIGDSACVSGQASITENARVLESALVTDACTVSGNATVKGTAFLYNKETVTGQAMPDGDYYDDSGRTLEKGSMYGWASPDAYVASRPFTDGQMAALEFDSAALTDTYTSTYAVPMEAPVWEAERTSANGVMTFDGSNYLIADSSYAMLHDATYQTAVLLRDDPAILFRFGSKEKSMTLSAIGGALTFQIKNGDTSEKLTAENAYTPGEWFTVSVVLTGDEGKLVVNGKTAASGTLTLDPVDVVSPDAVYTIGGTAANGMNGSMDLFRVYDKEVPAPDYYYTAKEDIAPTQALWYYGDMDSSSEIDIYDLALLKRAVLAGENAPCTDCDADGTLGVGDVIALTRYVHGLPEHGRTGQANTAVK
ncbi:MAG: hypothetical protein K5695_04530 [Oscillospiraceae bacterium]|nr:hypothetical protein [Oscillospiraceae bacterium]